MPAEDFSVTETDPKLFGKNEILETNGGGEMRFCEQR